VKSAWRAHFYFSRALQGTGATRPHTAKGFPGNPAGMAGTTRSRVNVFMNEFKAPVIIEYNRKIKANTSLLTLVLDE